jgi:hypothetical protein
VIFFEDIGLNITHIQLLEMSDDIHRFVERLVAKEPGAPGSIQLEVDTDGDAAALFEVLLLIMTEVLKKWYAPPISVGRISVEDLQRLTAYFMSFNIKFDLAQEPLPPVCVLHNRDYLNKSQLSDMKFKITYEDKLYTVRFSNI